jgi:hypothetical protein
LGEGGEELSGGKKSGISGKNGISPDPNPSSGISIFIETNQLLDNCHFCSTKYKSLLLPNGADWIQEKLLFQLKCHAIGSSPLFFLYLWILMLVLVILLIP